MSTQDIIYFSIFLLIIAVGSFGGGWIINHIWFKVTTLYERTAKWQRNGGKW